MSDLPEERLQRYRRMADGAHAAARNATCVEIRDAFIGIAAVWESLIDELVQDMQADQGQGLLSGDALSPISFLVDKTSR
jgi:hypothetical protein